jgi:hypothetical protein
MKNKNISYSPSFVGHVTNNASTHTFVEQMRKVLRGSGFSVFLRARNSNRKQFYPEKNRVVHLRNGVKYTRRSDFQQDLPAKFASYFALYVRRSERDYNSTWNKDKRKLLTIVDAVKTAAKVYGLQYN